MADSAANAPRWSRWLPLLLLAAIMVLGAGARLVNAGGSASLWFDEAWRIQKLLDADSLLRQIVSRPNHIDPPVFSLAVALLARLHNSELVLRLVSIVPGVLAILLAWRVGRHLFHGQWLPLFPPFLIAFSASATIYSKEMKPYSLALLIHLIVLLAAMRHGRSPTTRSTLLLTGLLLAALPCSPNIIFAWPGVCLLMLATTWSKGRGPRRAALFGTTGLLTAALLVYGMFLRGAGGGHPFDYLGTYWQDAFGPRGPVKETVNWYLLQGLALFRKLAYCHWPFRDSARAVLAVLYPLMALSGMVLVLRRSRRLFLRHLCLFLLPVLTMVPFGIAGLWPFGPQRVNLFILAYLAFLPFLLLDEWQRRRPGEGGFLPAGPVVLLLMALQFPVGFGEFARWRVETRHADQALEALIRSRPTDTPIPLLVNNTGRPAFAYYSRHHAGMSVRWQAREHWFETEELAFAHSRLYTMGRLLRHCQSHRQVAVFLAHPTPADLELLDTEFTSCTPLYDGHQVHAALLQSRITRFADHRRPFLSFERFSGTCQEWTPVHVSAALPLGRPAPGSLVVINFHLKFNGVERNVRLRFIDQDGRSGAFHHSMEQNRSPRIPRRFSGAVYTLVTGPVESVGWVIEVEGDYDIVVTGAECFIVPPDDGRAAGH